MPEDAKDTTEQSKDTPEVKDWTGYAATLPEKAKALHDAHYAGLVSGHERVKTERNDLRTALKELKGAKGEERDAKIEEIQAALDASTKTNAFHDSCPPEISNRRAARALAKEFDCIRGDGTLDVDKFKQECPSQFVEAKDTKGYGGKGNRTVAKDNTPAHQVINDALFGAR